MKMLSIKNGYVTLQLSAAQCAALAKACQVAGEETLSQDIDHWRTLALLFHACAIASYAQWQMCSCDIAALERQLLIVGLADSVDTPPDADLNGIYGKCEGCV